MNEREMYGELTALIHAVAARLDLDVEAVAKAFETGAAQIDFAEDEDGNRALLVTCGDRQAAVSPQDLAVAAQALADQPCQGTIFGFEEVAGPDHGRIGAAAGPHG